jgi:hypothetical protein
MFRPELCLNKIVFIRMNSCSFRRRQGYGGQAAIKPNCSRAFPAQAFSPLTLFASVFIGIEPGRTSLRLEAMARQGPALQNIEHSILNIQPSTMETGGKRCPALSAPIPRSQNTSAVFMGGVRAGGLARHAGCER